MKAFLMHRDRDFDLEEELPVNAEALIQDLELETLFAAMAGGNQFLFDVARVGLLSSLADPAEITFRQGVLRDALANPAVVREIYDLALETIRRRKSDYLGTFASSPGSVLSGSLRVMEAMMEMLQRLRRISDEHAAEFRSDGFVTLFRTLSSELDDEYFRTVVDHLRELQFRGGVPISAGLGRGNSGRGYVLHRNQKRGWTERIPFMNRSSRTYQVADRDEAGSRALGELRDRGVNLAANALAQSADHIASFFNMLAVELAFYVGCLNLHERIAENDEATCLPVPTSGRPELRAQGLYDVCLSLTLDGPVNGNDVSADGRSLVMITGANQGGKSTFLRSVGLAQLMMQAGMFVPAKSFRADVREGIFTHFKREEDVTMESGKLDEELARMSDMVDQLGPRSILLFNESFASTNEREGSEIARQIIRALLERGIKVFFVTHMFDLAHGLYSPNGDRALFLRAERGTDGRRTFRVTEGEPLPTSHAEDLYRRIFGAALDPAGLSHRSSAPRGGRVPS